MSISLWDYLLDHEEVDWASALKGWAWLLPPELTVWMANRYGDLFLIFEDGAVHLLDTGSGSLRRLADSREEFADRMDQDDNANQWLMIPLVDRLVAAGMHLSTGRCYGFRTPPVLGGPYTVENTAIISTEEHLRFCGSLHEQIRDIPDGGKVILRVQP